MASGNIKNFELKLGKTALLIVIIGMAVLLCGSFLFGIAVGKNIDTYPEKIATLPQKLLAMVWRPARIRAAQTAAENKTVQNQPQKPEEIDLTFYNTLTSKKGAAKDQPIPDKKPAAEAPAQQPLLSQPKKESAVPAGSSVPELKAEIKKPQAAAGDEIEAKIKEAERTVAIRQSQFSVQVASLRDKIKAEQMNKKLLALGYKPRVAENIVPGKGKWFRVVVDGFATRKLAQVAAENIADKTGSSCIVRRMDVTHTGN